MEVERRTPMRRALHLLRRHPLGIFGLVVIVTLVVSAIFAEQIAPYDPAAIEFDQLQSPTLAHPFGTDRLGRDVFSRVVMGSRVSMVVGMISIIIGVTGAAALGILSGFLGGRIDNLIQRAMDVLLAFPGLVLLLAIVSVLGNPDATFREFLSDKTPIPEGSFLGIPKFLDALIVSVAIAIGIVAGVTRIVRGAVLSEKQNVYIEAARAMGASDFRIMARHILPNVFALVVVLASILLPVAILAEAALTFLGLGLPEPIPSWGADLGGRNREAAQLGFWWPVFFPGLALSLVVLGFNMMGDALRDIGDPRLRGSGGPGGGGGGFGS
ncbi:MAG: ABC transporter permease [Chloroflexi bacterium]|nr:ABC transporter permease [Chloroflexota bacterium]